MGPPSPEKRFGDILYYVILTISNKVYHIFAKSQVDTSAYLLTTDLPGILISYTVILWESLYVGALIRSPSNLFQLIRLLKRQTKNCNPIYPNALAVSFSCLRISICCGHFVSHLPHSTQFSARFALLSSVASNFPYSLCAYSVIPYTLW